MTRTATQFLCSCCYCRFTGFCFILRCIRSFCVVTGVRGIFGILLGTYFFWWSHVIMAYLRPRPPPPPPPELVCNSGMRSTVRAAPDNDTAETNVPKEEKEKGAKNSHPGGGGGGKPPPRGGREGHKQQAQVQSQSVPSQVTGRGRSRQSARPPGRHRPAVSCHRRLPSLFAEGQQSPLYFTTGHPPMAPLNQKRRSAPVSFLLLVSSSLRPNGPNPPPNKYST